MAPSPSSLVLPLGGGVCLFVSFFPSFPLPCKLAFPSCFVTFSPVPRLFVSLLFFYFFVSPSFFFSLSLSTEFSKNKGLNLAPVLQRGPHRHPSLGFGARGLCERKFKSAQGRAELCSGQVKRCLEEGSGQDHTIAGAHFPNIC